MIDTRAKRLSLLSFGKPGFVLPEGPAPFSSEDKRHFLGLYASTVFLVEDKGIKGITGDAYLSVSRISLQFVSGSSVLAVTKIDVLSISSDAALGTKRV